MIALDFFCGAGGITKGLSNAGIKVLAGFDISNDVKATYEKNNSGKFVPADIRNISYEDIYNAVPEISGNEDDLLIAGCAPCQPFSKQRREKEYHKDSDLLLEFARVILPIKPAHILIENVPGLATKGHDILDDFLNLLDKNGYKYKYNTINACDYGVPQRRKRFVLIASRSFKPEIPEGKYGDPAKGKLRYVTVRDAIGNYPALKAGEEYKGKKFENHRAVNLQEITLKRIRATPHDGGSRKDWPKELFLKCHMRQTGHGDVYGRMAWDKIAPTLTNHCTSISNGRYGHPEQDRAISFREAATLQSFPEDYVFYGNNVSISRQIGNAVPVLLSQELGKYIVSKSYRKGKKK